MAGAEVRARAESGGRTALARDDAARGVLPTLVVVAAAYVLGAELAWGWLGASAGLAFFPAAGVTFAALILQRPRRWPAILLVVLVAETVVDLRHGLRWPAIGYALANVVEPLVGATVLRRFSADPVAGLGRRRGFVAFLAAGVLLGPLAGAVCGATTRTLDNSSDWLSNVAHWMAGDGLGVLAIGGPVIVLVGEARAHRRVALGAAAQLVAVAFVLSLLVFWWIDVPIAILILPLLVWAAMRFELVGVALTTPVIATVANLATARGSGPFAAVASVSSQSRLSLAQVFLAIVVLTAWFFAIETGERAWAQDARRREEEGRRVAERDRAAGSLAAGLAHASTTGEMLDVTTEYLRLRKGADNVVLMVTDGREDGVLVPYAVDGIGAEMREQIASSAVRGDLPARAALRESIPVWIPTHAELVRRFPAVTSIPASADIESLAAVPVEVGPARRACLVATWRAPRELDEWDRSQMLAAARLVGQAMERARLFEAERRAASRVRALQRLTARLADVATMDEVHGALVDEVTTTLARGAVLARSLAGAPPVIVATAGYTAAAAAALHASPLADAFVDGTVVAHDLRLRAEDLPEWATEVAAAGDQRVVAVPFEVAHGPSTYVLLLGSSALAPFEDHDVDEAFHRLVGEQCARAIERATQRHAEHDAIVHLQTSLLSHSPDTPEGVRIATRYLPATHPFTVGGDWHDVISLADGRCVLVVGDVVGSGLPASITMAQLRSSARALARHCTPAEILEELDRYASTLSNALCTTVACVVVDAPNRTLRYSLAGHVFPMVRRRSGAVEVLDGGAGLPLGVVPRPRHEGRLDLATGDVVVLYTDGLVERRNEVLDSGFARLAAALAAADPQAPDLCDGLIDACLDGHVQRDDIVVLTATVG